MATRWLATYSDEHGNIYAAEDLPAGETARIDLSAYLFLSLATCGSYRNPRPLIGQMIHYPFQEAKP
jgi:hypothetical protein